MKIQIKSILTLFSIAIISFSTSCKKDDPDTEAPVIVSVEEPLNDDTLYTGNELHVDLKVTDNEGLSQVKIDIHSAEDGHSHGKIAAGAYWEEIRIVNVSGTSFDMHEHIDIPTTAAAGKYHVIITAVDKAGNQSAITERDVYILNSGDLVAPVITLTGPAAGSSISSGSMLMVAGNIADNDELYEVKVMVYRGSTLVYEWETETTIANYALEHSINTTGWSTGTYKVEVKAYDHVMNHSDTDVEITVN
jgi:hypothetical protein